MNQVLKQQQYRLVIRASGIGHMAPHSGPGTVRGLLGYMSSEQADVKPKEIDYHFKVSA